MIYNERKFTVKDLTEEQKALIKHLYLEKDLSMSNVSRESGISPGVVQRFIKEVGWSKDRLKAIKQYHKTKDPKTKLVRTSELSADLNLTPQYYIDRGE
jgi:predicted DNA-binding protein YlxM (UPF0122 family)